MVYKPSEKTINLSIAGMHCANCVSNVEKKYQRTPGVLSVVVNLAANSATVVYDSNRVSVRKLINVLEDTQFEASVVDSKLDVFSDKVTSKHKKKLKLDLIKLCVSIGLTAIILLIHYFFEPNFGLNILQLLLTIPIQFWCGWDFIKGAVKSIKNFTANMDVLVAVGTLLTFFYSVYACFVSGHPYFETSAMLISFISFGEYIENRAKIKTNKAVEELVKLIPEQVKVMEQFHDEEALASAFENGDDIKTTAVSREDVKPGDFVLIVEGDNIPADSVIVGGQAKVDESMITGESDALSKSVDDEITAGTKLISGFVIAKVIRENKDSTLAKIINAVMEAQASKAPIARYADRIAGIFVPIVLLIAVGVFVYWFNVTEGIFVLKLQQAMMTAVSILTVACPCALVLATPITLTVAMGRGAQLGIIIRDGVVLETLCKVKNMIFDKTGTLTKSNLDKDENAAKTLRDDAKESLEALQKDMRIKTYMLSGDTKDEALRIAKQLDIDEQNVVWKADPVSKKDHLEKLMDDIKEKSQHPKREKFGYVGDGINDAPAMACADVSITLESATDIALESGNVVLMHNKLNDLVTAIRLSKASMRKIRQNMFWALCYNLVLIPLAACGFILPMWCGAIHAVSSLIVVFNALLLKRFK